ncbi:MAG TPA: hypothetical protein ACFYD4_07535 [Candidatus Wunengus sp. YC61]|uniref:hypothetical protein n=1 Tax=Candidatus Wunengus sp. YC61 TaxID=3367698 RepID=UPI0040299994
MKSNVRNTECNKYSNCLSIAADEDLKQFDCDGCRQDGCCGIERPVNIPKEEPKPIKKHGRRRPPVAAKKVDIVRSLLGKGLSDGQIGQQAECSYWTVRRIRLKQGKYQEVTQTK